LIFVTLFLTLFSQAQDSLFLRVSFLYGSKPQNQFKDSEKKWFGGMLGGHVGIECGANRYFSFEGRGKQHVFEKRKNKHSIYRRIDSVTFWNIMGTPGDSVKKLSVILPVNQAQVRAFDSITKSYLAETPYDYAVFGMRCGASTYEILAQLGILKPYSHFWTYMKIFYPRRLRKRLIAKADTNSWTMIREEGTQKRKWEKDMHWWSLKNEDINDKKSHTTVSL
jgi:hypothetical protein